MQLANYKIVFKGEIESGYELEKVKQDITEFLQLDLQQLNEFFSGSKVSLKKNITYEQAEKYLYKLKSLGLIVYLEEEEMTLNGLEQGQEELKIYSTANTTHQVKEPNHQQAKAMSAYSNNVIDSPAVWGFNFSGRFGRLNLINVQLILTVVFLLVYLLFVLVLLPNNMFEEIFRDVGNNLPVEGGLYTNTTTKIPLNLEYGINVLIRGASLNLQIIFAILLIINILWFVCSFRITVLRLHDINLSARWGLIHLLSFLVLQFPVSLSSVNFIFVLVYLVFFLFLLIAPGTKGENRYGLPVKKGSIFGLICWFIIILLVIVVFVSLMAMLTNKF